MQIEQKIGLVKALLSGELAEIHGKSSFWDQKLVIEGVAPLFQKPGSLTLDQVLPTVTKEELLKVDDQTLKTVGIAWEFVWGKHPPEIVTELKQSIRIKAECGLEMDDFEKLWYQLSTIDTDMF
jgi:hypothetical protein